MKHVAPHKWADAWAGKLPDAERDAVDRHAAECPACTKVRERVTRASDSFLTIRNQQAPDVGWDSVRAKVHWSVSTERRAKVEPRSITGSRAGWIAAGACAVAGAVATIAVDLPSPPSQPAAIVVPAPIQTPQQDRPATALVGLVNRTTGDLMIDGIRADDPFAKRLAAGTVIATGVGRVDVQFGHASAFHLAPHSRLELVRFDDRTVELSVEGTIDITIAPRTSNQTFVVRAGAHTIEVRGTQFRVEHHGRLSTKVACRHGLVAVRDSRGGQIEVGAARRVELRNVNIVGERVVAMSTDEVTELADATPLMMPVWDVSTTASAPLDIATAGRHPVRLDGVEIGEAPMRVRTTPGRHTVEVANHGRYRRVGWVDVAPNASRPARIEIQPEPPPTRGIDERRRQFRGGIDRGKIAACTRVAAKQGLVVGAYVQIEIAVDAQGAVGFLNLLETDLPRKLAGCIDGVLKEVHFKPGPAASWRERIDL